VGLTVVTHAVGLSVEIVAGLSVADLKLVVIVAGLNVAGLKLVVIVAGLSAAETAALRHRNRS